MLLKEGFIAREDMKMKRNREEMIIEENRKKEEKYRGREERRASEEISITRGHEQNFKNSRAERRISKT